MMCHVVLTDVNALSMVIYIDLFDIVRILSKISPIACCNSKSLT